MQEAQKNEVIEKPVQNEVPQNQTPQVTETVTKAPETKNAVPNNTEPKTVQKTQAESKPAEQKAPENTKPKTAPITDSKPVQKTESVQNAEPVEYAKSVEELMAEQMTSKKKKKEFDCDMFEDDLQEENSQNYVQTQKTKNPVQTQASSFSGEAGVSAEQNVSSIKSCPIYNFSFKFLAKIFRPFKIIFFSLLFFVL